jgi:hypothetical protein
LEPSIWSMLYEIRWWTSSSLHLFHVHVQFFTQTLTRLYLGNNQIEEKAKRHAMETLKKNTRLKVSWWWLGALTLYWMIMEGLTREIFLFLISFSKYNIYNEWGCSIKR